MPKKKNSNFIMKTKKVNFYNSESYEKKLCCEDSDTHGKLSAIVHNDQTSLSDCCNISCTACNLNVSNSFSITKTPSDNNVVPNEWESTVYIDDTKKMCIGEEAVDLDLGGSITNSFSKSSDSLDNKCIINEEDFFRDVMDGFEANTVSRNKDYLLSKSNKLQTYKSMKDYMHSMLLTEIIGPARFSIDRSEDDVNRVGYKSFVGYYSEYFGVNKPFYNNSVIGAKGQKKPEDVYRAERCITKSEGRASFNKKIGISHLIDYFESTHHEDRNNSIVTSYVNKQLEIFKEVDDVRKRETISKNFENLHLNTKSDVNFFEDDIIPPPLAFQSCSSSYSKQGYAKPKVFVNAGGNNIKFSIIHKTVLNVKLFGPSDSI